MTGSRTSSPTYSRLTQPMVRDKGKLRPASWDEALDRAAEGFRRNIDAHVQTRSASSPAPSPPMR